MKRTCLYHGSDLDGICSAAIIKTAFPETTLIPVEYGIKVALDSLVSDGDDVTIVDFVLQPFEDMKFVSENNNLVWIDHHDTAISEYEEYLKNKSINPIAGIRDVDKSACELTWNWCYPGAPTPYSVWLLGRYDVWSHHESDSIVPFQYGMKLNYEPPEDTKFWDKLFSSKRDSDRIQTIMRQGKTIIKYRTRLNKKLCEIQAFKSSILGYSCLCANRALCGSSIFDSVEDKEDYDILVVFYVCSRGAWNVSMYTTKPDVHVGKIAQLFGGGGHASAAGFRCTILPFEVSA